MASLLLANQNYEYFYRFNKCITKKVVLFDIFSEKDIKDGGKNQQFNGPATNCEELGLIGYTLNGYYLVKKSTDLTKKGTIGFVYCQFQQLHGKTQGKI